MMDSWIKGMDVSSLMEVEKCGGRFYDHGKSGDAMKILKDYGMNMVRLRLWNDPFAEDGSPYGAGGNDLETTLALAKRAKKMGAGWILDFQYSDHWADPGKQTIPKAWRGFGTEELERAVYDYTAEVLRRCRQEDVMPQIVAVGNELSNGLLWPYGKVPEYENIAKFVSAGIRAVRSVDEKASVMIHLDNGGNNQLYRTWFDTYFSNNGEDFEYIGLSYYPFWHGTVDMLRANMNDIARRYHKKLILVEVSTGHTLEDYQSYEKLSEDQRKGMAAKPELAGKVPYPMTPEGQAGFMADIFKVIEQVPEGLGRGFCYWEPAWLPVPGSGWATEAALKYTGEKGPGGNEWANQALFDYDGNALPTLEVIRDFVPSGMSYSK
ncbi:MAG: glycosyl hydrolase 53 family protein [Lachnospiraceae bacterium]|nr:glycosyl hydrolase 53 family protein [Lachnospiraceae bacterium]